MTCFINGVAYETFEVKLEINDLNCSSHVSEASLEALNIKPILSKSLDFKATKHHLNPKGNPSKVQHNLVNNHVRFYQIFCPSKALKRWTTRWFH